MKKIIVLLLLSLFLASCSSKSDDSGSSVPASGGCGVSAPQSDGFDDSRCKMMEDGHKKCYVRYEL